MGERLLRLAPLGIALTFVALNLVGLDRSPVVWMDEVTLNDPARVLVDSGQLRSSVYADSAGFARGYFWQPPGQVLIAAPVYALAGVGIWQTRLPGLLLAGALLLVIAAIARQVGESETAGILAALVFALDPQLIQTARSGRMDAQCLLLALGGILLYLRSTGVISGRKTFGFLAGGGLLVGLAGVTHPVAAAWAPAIGASILLFDRGKLPRLLVFGVASAAPLLMWLTYAWVSDQWSLFVGQFIEHGAGHTAAGAPWTRVGDEVSRIISRYRLAPLLLLLYASALAWLGWWCRAQVMSRRIAVMAGVTFLFVALLMTKADAGFYFLHPLALAAVAAGTMAAAVPRLQGPTRVAAVVGLLAALGNAGAAGLGARWAALAYQWEARSYSPVAAAIREAVGPGSVVWGREESWYGLTAVGAELRVTGRPDANRHDFAIVRPESASTLPPSARLVRSLDTPLPPLFGRIVLPSQDYRLQIWRLR